MARLCRYGPARRPVRRGRRGLRRRRGRDDDRDGAIRQGARARALSSDRRPLRRASEARRQRGTARRAHRRDRRRRDAAELRPCGKAIGVRPPRCRLERGQGWRRRLRAQRRKDAGRPGRQRRQADRLGASGRRAARSRGDRSFPRRRQRFWRHPARLFDPGRPAGGGDRLRRCPRGAA